MTLRSNLAEHGFESNDDYDTGVWSPMDSNGCGACTMDTLSLTR